MLIIIGINCIIDTDYNLRSEHIVNTYEAREGEPSLASCLWRGSHMKATALLLAIALLLPCCACSSAPKGGDGYIPVAGLSFGMSVEEAMKAYPRLKPTEALDPIPPNADGLKPLLPNSDQPDESAKFVGVQGATDFIIDNIKVYGDTATVKLRFMKWEDYEIDNEVYMHDYGLRTVFISFLEPVKTGEILKQLDGLFDFEWKDEWEEQRHHYVIR